jgi:ADP-ribose pyrophosphatase YjhB (NUDIX family)
MDQNGVRFYPTADEDRPDFPHMTADLPDGETETLDQYRERELQFVRFVGNGEGAMQRWFPPVAEEAPQGSTLRALGWNHTETMMLKRTGEGGKAQILMQEVQLPDGRRLLKLPGGFKMPRESNNSTAWREVVEETRALSESYEPGTGLYGKRRGAMFQLQHRVVAAGSVDAAHDRRVNAAQLIHDRVLEATVPEEELFGWLHEVDRQEIDDAGEHEVDEQIAYVWIDVEWLPELMQRGDIAFAEHHLGYILASVCHAAPTPGEAGSGDPEKVAAASVVEKLKLHQWQQALQRR